MEKRLTKPKGFVLEQKDFLIYSFLRRNSRMSLTKMAKLSKIPVSTIHERIKNSKVVKKFTTLLDFARVGYPVRLNMLLKIDKTKREELLSYLLRYRQVNNILKVNNGFDFLCEGIFVDIKEAELFVENIEKEYNIKKVQLFYTLEDLKREEFIG